MRLAYVNGSTLLVCAFACVPFALFDDASLLLPALALGASGAVELRGARMLRDLDLRAPRWLATNQLVLLALIAVYCAAGIVHALHAPSVVDELSSSAPGRADQLRDATAGFGLTDGRVRSRLSRVRGAVLRASCSRRARCIKAFALTTTARARRCCARSSMKHPRG